MNKDNPLTEDDYCWLYLALGYMAGAWLKENPTPVRESELLARTLAIRNKLQVLREQQKEQTNK
jgi:hypothetical protein